METKLHCALVLKGNGIFEMRNVPSRIPGDYDVVVEPLWVGVCGTDMDIIRGSRPDTPLILGHEGVGSIVNVGSGVQNYKIGDLVVFNPVNPNKPDDVLGHSREGLLQRRVLVDLQVNNPQSLVRFDPNLNPLCGALIEPLATVIYGHTLVSQVVCARKVAVIGGGSIGLLNTKFSRDLEGAEICLVDKSASRLKWAIKHGFIDADKTIISSTETCEELLDKNGGRFDSVYLCCTRDSALAELQNAIRVVRPGGCIDLVVGFQDRTVLPYVPNLRPNQVRRTNTCGNLTPGFVATLTDHNGKFFYLTGHRGTSSLHLNKAMEIFSQGIAPFESVISHIVPIEASGRILSMVALEGVQSLDNGNVGKIIISL